MVATALNGILEGLAIATAAPRVARSNDVDSETLLEGGCVVNCANSVGGIAASLGQELGADQSDIPVDSGNTNSVASCPTDGACHVGAMLIVTKVIHRSIVVSKVPSVNVIDVAVAIVISPVGGFTGVSPHIVTEVFVIDVDTFVDDNDICVACPNESGGPSFGRLAAKCV